MIAEYTPAAKFAGTSTEILGFQLATPVPVLAPVTTDETPVRSVGENGVARMVADSVMGPVA